jgi:hypothetical protein
MLSTIIAAANFVVAKGGAIDDPDSALFAPKTFKYTHTQIVGGLIVDIVIEVLLLAALGYAAWRYWGPPSRKAGGTDDAVTLRSEGVLLGIQPWAWSIICMAFITVVVLGSVLFYS